MIGREPTGNAPEMRGAWLDAFLSITKADGVDVRALSDSSLLHMRNSYQTETGWAPLHVGKHLAMYASVPTPRGTGQSAPKPKPV